MVLLLFFLVCIALILWYLNHLLDYWKNRKVSDVWTEIITEFHDPVPHVEKYKVIYNSLSGHPFGGHFQQFRPQLFIRDPDLIQRTLSTDFDYFRDRGNTRFEEHDPLTIHLFSAPGTLWKKLRIRLSPTFTSGKIKYMFNLIKECADELERSLLKQATAGVSADIKDSTVNYTVEVISSTAFGLKSNSMTSDSEFKKISRQIYPNRLDTKLRFMVYDWFPSLQAYLHLPIFDKHLYHFFSRLVQETVSYRKENNVSRNDFLQLLMSLNESSKTADNVDNRRTPEELLEFTNDLMTAQCFNFFVAGFDTSSLILSATLLELAVHQDVQRTLHNEIDHFMKKYNNEITYEMIREMPYLHKVVYETMRKYPVIPGISRVSTKTYHIPDSDVIIEKGTEIVIPTTGLHYDPKYFPNPEKFDPERFTDEEINSRHKFAYLPFGGGPRICVGGRFGLATVKLGLVHLLQNYRFDTTAQTIYPVKFQPFRKINDYDHELLLNCSLRNE